MQLKVSGVFLDAVQLISVSDTAPTSPVNGDMWFNSTDTNTYMWYSDGDSNQWIQLNGTGTVVQNITNNVFDTPTITSVSPANYNGTDATTFTIIGTNFNVGTIVTFIDSGGNEYNASTTSVITQGELTAVTPQAFTAEQGPLDVKVTTGGGAATVTATDMIQTGGSPVWTTAAGNLGDFNKDSIPNPVADLDATDIPMAIPSSIVYNQELLQQEHQLMEVLVLFLALLMILDFLETQHIHLLPELMIQQEIW